MAKDVLPSKGWLGTIWQTDLDQHSPYYFLACEIENSTFDAAREILLSHGTIAQMKTHRVISHFSMVLFHGRLSRFLIFAIACYYHYLHKFQINTLLFKSLTRSERWMENKEWIELRHTRVKNQGYTYPCLCSQVVGDCSRGAQIVQWYLQLKTERSKLIQYMHTPYLHTSFGK